jgi:hypothetical protein
MEKISPTTKLTKEKKEYVLEDKDYLLIKAIQDLTNSINKLRGKIK